MNLTSFNQSTKRGVLVPNSDIVFLLPVAVFAEIKILKLDEAFQGRIGMDYRVLHPGRVAGVFMAMQAF